MNRLLKTRLTGISLPMLLILWLGGCASLQTPEPDVLLLGITPVQSEGLAPAFDVKLKLVNAGGRAFTVNGVSAQVYLEGHKIAVGSAAQAVSVPAYGDGLLTVRASGDLFGGLGLFQDLLSRQRESFDYRLVVKLDVGGSFLPLTVDRTGTINLSGSGKR